MKYVLKRTVDPTTEPVTVAEIKAHLRIDWSDEDEGLVLYLKAAREYAEAYTARSFAASTYQMRFAEFPEGEPIRVPRLPLIAITALTYTDGAGNVTTMDVGDLETVSGDDVAEVNPGHANNNIWPSVPTNGRATMTFTAGYTATPAAAKQSVLHHAASLYRNREAVSELPLKEAPLAVHSLLDTIRNYSTTF